MTPFRCFRPELDVLYLDQESIFHLNLLHDPEHSDLPGAESSETSARRCFEIFMDLLRRTRRFAVPVALALADGFLGILSDHLRYETKTAAPASLYIVLPYTTPSVWRGIAHEGPGLFVPPGRRCRLATVSPVALEDDTVVVVVEGASPRRAVTARQAVEDVYRLLDEQREGTEEWEEVGMLGGLELQARVFVEHQGGGAWREACRERMYDGAHHPSSRIEVPLSRRPNPELVRVHDTDAVFRPVHVDWVSCIGLSRR